jgi:hypothetical protein
VSEVTAHLASPDDARLDALAKVAAMLEWPLPRERDEAVCAEAAHTVDRLLAPIARGSGAVDIAIGGRLDLLSVGDRVLRLGYSGIGDYARERVGIAASTARKMARLARELRDRPIVRLAVQSGEMSVRQAEAVLPVARGDAEASWVARALVDTVRGLKVEVKNTDAPDPEEDEEDEEFERLSISISAEARPDVDEGLALAGKALGANVPKALRYGALCEEFLSLHGQTMAVAGPNIPTAIAPALGSAGTFQAMSRTSPGTQPKDRSLSSSHVDREQARRGCR